MPRTDSKERGESAERTLHGLLVEALGGDAVAYRRFLDALAGHLRAYYRRRLFALPDEVEDLVQEALIAVHNQRHTYDAAQPLTAWVYAIARYKMVDLLRHRAGREAITDPYDDESLFASSDRDAADAKRDVEKLLLRLPDRHRLPILHVKIEGRSVEEAAAMTGMSVSAIKVGVHRGLKTLARMIREDQDAPRRRG
jgi:RNA polymerase sigma-70 factor (ECF subfamily)